MPYFFSFSSCPDQHALTNLTVITKFCTGLSLLLNYVSFLTLDCSDYDALDQIFLNKRIYDQNRQDTDHRHCHPD